MKHFIFAIILFSSLLYFSLASILGISVGEDGSSDVSYKYYCIGLFLTFIYLYLRQYAGKKISSSHAITICVLLFYLVVGILSGYTFDTSVLTLVAFGFPASGIAVYYAEHGNIGRIIKWIDVLLPLFSVSLVFSLRQLFTRIADGTSYYSQELSYDAAYCFVLYMFFLLFGNQYDRFSFFKSGIYKWVSILMLPYTLIVMFSSGGRGALVTASVGLILLMYLYHGQFRIKKKYAVRTFFIIFVATIVTFSYMSKESQDIFSTNFYRVFSFFDTSQDMFTRTSGRNEALKPASEQINQNLIFGSGLFSYKSVFVPKTGLPYPHNIFVEILLQGGYIFLIVFSVFLLLLLTKLKIILRHNQQELVAILAVFSLTMLQFSGSYIHSPFFWFFAVYVYNFKFRKRIYEKKNIISVNQVS